MFKSMFSPSPNQHSFQISAKVMFEFLGSKFLMIQTFPLVLVSFGTRLYTQCNGHPAVLCLH